MSTQSFRFLDLAPELREKIYILMSKSARPYISLNSRRAHSSFPLNFLLTNTQIYHELRPLYFTSNAFSITLNRRTEDWDYFLSTAWQDNRRQIRTLRLNITRWGAKDFFTNKLVPVLEDCILNGHLRDLEVRMKEGWMGYGGKSYVIDGNRNENGGEENGTWVSLMKLLRDPYLERAVLMAGPYGDVEEGYEGPPRSVNLEYSEFIPFQIVRWVLDDSEEGAWRKTPEYEAKTRDMRDHRTVTQI
jgi:hypothetical protein